METISALIQILLLALVSSLCGLVAYLTAPWPVWRQLPLRQNLVFRATFILALLTGAGSVVVWFGLALTFSWWTASDLVLATIAVGYVYYKYVLTQPRVAGWIGAVVSYLCGSQRLGPGQPLAGAEPDGER